MHNLVNLVDLSGEAIGQLTVPSGSVVGSDLSPVVIDVEGMAASELRAFHFKLSAAAQNKFGKETLSNQEVVVSAVVKISSSETDLTFHHDMELELTSDIDSPELCLAELKGSEWVCTEGNTKLPVGEQSKVVAPLSGFGTYAVIFAPGAEDAPLPEDLWAKLWAEYKIPIIIGACLLFVIVILVTYAVCRLTRYRRKYRAGKEDMQEMQQIRERDEENVRRSSNTVNGDMQVTVNPMLFAQSQQIQKRLNDVEKQMENVESGRDQSALEKQKEILSGELDKIRKQGQGGPSASSGSSKRKASVFGGMNVKLRSSNSSSSLGKSPKDGPILYNRQM
jgi:hypothetical protein